MKRINQFLGHFMVTLLLLATVFSCATVSDLKVLYRLPPESDALKGKRVFLGFEDKRATKDILGKEARKEFGSFSGNISYSLARDKEPGFRIGVYDVPSLFMEVFKKRLENLGAEVVPGKREAEIGVVVALEEFFLDLVDRRWVVRMGYEARLVRDGDFLAKQMISGKGERYKLVGRGQADKVMGDIFTDMVNRLDVSRLFQQASLL